MLYKHVKLFYFIVIILSLGFIKINAQEFEWLSNDFPNSQFLGVYEIDNKYYGAVSNGATGSFDSNTIHQLSIYELLFNEDGIVLDEIRTIPYEDNYATISLDFIEETELWLIVQSKVLDSNRQSYRVMLCNKDFDILVEKSIDTTGNPIPFQIDSRNGISYILGSILGPPNYLFFAKYDHANPLVLQKVEVKQSTPNSIFAAMSMIIDDSQDMIVFYYGGITKLDSNLHQEFKLGYNEINTAYYGSIVNIESNYYTHSLTVQSFGNGFKSLVIQKYDSLFHIIKADTIGIEGQDNYPFLTKSIDYKFDELLVGGHLDGPFAHLFLEKSIKKFYLAKYDTDLNRIWYKEFGGERAYMLMGLKILENDNIVAYGYVTDTITGLWYGYIMYVDQNGEIVNTINIPLYHNSHVTIINPGNDYMHLVNSKGVSGTLEIYSLQGHHIASLNITSTEHYIPLNKLSAGNYPYLLHKDGIILQSGVWVKEN